MKAAAPILTALAVVLLVSIGGYAGAYLRMGERVDIWLSISTRLAGRMS